MTERTPSDRPPLIVVVGPTAAGKTSVALEMAQSLDAEIISADSVAVYRGFDIGSAKPDQEELALARHHLIDVVDWDQDFNAAAFARLADRAVDEIDQRGKRAIVAGGTGLYVRALLNGLFQAPPVDRALRDKLAHRARRDPAATHARLAEVDPESAVTVEPNDIVRMVRALEVFEQTGRPITALRREQKLDQPRYRVLKLGLAVDRRTLAQRIAQRTAIMLEHGLIDETRALLARGVDPKAKPMQSIGYKQAVEFVTGRADLAETSLRIIRETKKLAKRQMTWFRADSEILWLPVEDGAPFTERARKFLTEVETG